MHNVYFILVALSLSGEFSIDLILILEHHYRETAVQQVSLMSLKYKNLWLGANDL